MHPASNSAVTRDSAAVMSRYDLTTRLVGRLDDAAVIGGIGSTNHDLWASGQRPQNFYMLGSMGLAVPIALGVALAQPSRKVIALEGDGSLLMQLGTLGTVAACRPANLTIIVFDNGVYNITGGQRTLTSHTIDVVAMARGAGLRNSHWAADPAHFDALVEQGCAATARASSPPAPTGSWRGCSANSTPPRSGKASRPVWAWPEPWRAGEPHHAFRRQNGKDRALPSSMAGQRMRELRAAGRDVIGLTAGEPDFATPDNIQQAALRAMRNGQTKYTDVGGVPELKAAVAEKFRRENSLAYRQDQIIVSSGAKQVIFNALLCLVQRGDEVVIPAPYWVSYPDMVRFAGGTPVAVACAQQHRFKLQPDELERAITPRTRCLILNSPNNPSGAAYDETELKALAQVLLRHPDICVITDDIYEHLLYDGRRFATIAAVEPALADRVLTVNGVSKSYAMTGWRIGYAGGPAALIAQHGQAAVAKHVVPERREPGRRDRGADRPAGHHRVVQKAVPGAARPAGPAHQRHTGIALRHAGRRLLCLRLCAGLAGKRTPQGRTIDNDTDLALHLLDAEGVVVIRRRLWHARLLPPFHRRVGNPGSKKRNAASRPPAPRCIEGAAFPARTENCLG